VYPPEHKAPRLNRMWAEYRVEDAANLVLFRGNTFIYENKMSRKVIKRELKTYSDY